MHLLRFQNNTRGLICRAVKYFCKIVKIAVHIGEKYHFLGYSQFLYALAEIIKETVFHFSRDLVQEGNHVDNLAALYTLVFNHL